MANGIKMLLTNDSYLFKSDIKNRKKNTKNPLDNLYKLQKETIKNSKWLENEKICNIKMV